MQGDNGGKGGQVGGPQTAELPGTQQDTAADNGSTRGLPRQSKDADSARSKNGMHPRHQEKPMCAAFKEYEEVPETVPLDFAEDDATGVASNLSGAAGALGAQAIKLRNWLLRFRFFFRGVKGRCRQTGWLDGQLFPSLVRL